MRLEQIAEELVNVTSALVGGRTINIMDKNSVIIASSDPTRIGVYHYGAEQVLRYGHAVNITRDQLDAYPGAREGCNMPLRQNGRIIGVVGIFGNPDEIVDLAHLLEVYATKYIELESVVRQQMEEITIRKKLYHLLTSHETVHSEYIHTLCAAVSFQLQMPLLPIAIRYTQPEESLTELIQLLLQENFLKESHDLYCEESGCLMILKGMEDNTPQFLLQTRKALQKSLYGLLQKHADAVHITFGQPCFSQEHLAIFCRETQRLNMLAPTLVESTDSPEGRCILLMDAAISDQEYYLRSLYERLQSLFRPDELFMLLKSAEAYYYTGHSVTKAAARLFIHKNTLQYRLHRLLEAMQVNEESPFCQEFLVRLILQYIKNYTGE